MTDTTSHYPKEAARFAKDTTEHAMTVLHNDGLYRHLRFKKPGTSMYWFDIITWPGYLTITGDMGTFTFQRVEDMFEFFRASSDINPQYWSEKVRAGTGNGDACCKEYSEDLFKQHVNECVAEYVESLDQAQKDELTEAVKVQILESGDTYYEAGARGVLADFAECVNERMFYDTWEWDLSDYTVQFLWCCFAIRWGIAQFDLDFEGRDQGGQQDGQHPREQTQSDKVDLAAPVGAEGSEGERHGRDNQQDHDEDAHEP